MSMDELTLPRSTEADYLKRSVMRELLRHAVDPQIISLAGGLPADEYLPTEQLRECFDTVLRRDGGRALQYGPMYMPLREWIAEYMQSRGVKCGPDNIFITSGSQQGLTILSRMFLNPGDVAVTEAITFTGVQQITAGRGAQMRVVQSNLESGANVDELEVVFSREPRPQLAVIIPDHHNPLGVSLSAEKRARIAQLAEQYNVPVLEDDPYSPLRFSGEMLPPIKGYDETQHVFYLGSFSKMLAPAARLGWIVAPVELMPQIVVFRESIDLESSGLTQRVAYEFLSNNLLQPHLDQLNAVNKVRCEAMLDALEEHLGGNASWTKPTGGLFVWVTLPENVDAWQMLQTAIEHQVAYIPGAAFAVEGGYRNTMRLNFSKVTPDAINEGVARLASVIHEQ